MIFKENIIVVNQRADEKFVSEYYYSHPSVNAIYVAAERPH